MSTCPNCNKQLEEGAKFCDDCGAQIAEAAVFCQNCGAQMGAQDAFCQSCGTPVGAAPAAVAAPEETAPKAGFKLPAGLNKKVLAIGGAAIAVVLVLAILISVIFTGGQPDYALYMKDGELMYYGMSGKPWQASEDMEGNSGSGNRVTKDGKKLFFRQDGNLYYRNVESKKEAVKLGNDVGAFYITETGNRVVFTTNDGNIYTHNLKDRTKIDSGIDYIIGCSENLKKVIYVKETTPEASEDDEYPDTEYDVYLYSGKEPVKLESGVTGVMAKEDCSAIYYIKNDDLYLKKGTKEGKKVDDDVSDIGAVYKDGDLYYIKDEEIQDGDNTEYKSSIYYYSGKKSTLVAEDYDEVVASCYESAMIVYSVDTTAENADEMTYDYFVAIKDKVTEIDAGVKFTFAPDGKSLYYLEEPSEETSKSDLYKIKISGKKLGKAEKYDTDVSYMGDVTVAENGTVWYFKDYEDAKATLCMNKKEVESDVQPESVSYNEASKTFTFYIDYESDKDTGTLAFSKNGKKTVKVDEDVYDFVVTPDGNLVYLKDQNEKSGKGDLYMNKLTKKSKKIDEDVSRLIRVYAWED